MVFLQSQYPPRTQLVPPTREDNLSVIVRTAKAMIKPTPPPKSHREASLANSHESHRTAQAQLAQALGVAPNTILSPTALIKYIASKAPAQNTQQQAAAPGAQGIARAQAASAPGGSSPGGAQIRPGAPQAAGAQAVQVCNVSSCVLFLMSFAMSSFVCFTTDFQDA
jgi:hypothetical protein